MVNDEGITTCFRADTGEQLGQRRLRGSFSASPIFADGLLFVPNESGTTFAVKPDPSLEIVVENNLGDGGGCKRGDMRRADLSSN